MEVAVVGDDAPDAVLTHRGWPCGRRETGCRAGPASRPSRPVRRRRGGQSRSAPTAPVTGEQRLDILAKRHPCPWMLKDPRMGDDAQELVADAPGQEPWLPAADRHSSIRSDEHGFVHVVNPRWPHRARTFVSTTNISPLSNTPVERIPIGDIDELAPPRNVGRGAGGRCVWGRLPASAAAPPRRVADIVVPCRAASVLRSRMTPLVDVERRLHMDNHTIGMAIWSSG